MGITKFPQKILAQTWVFIILSTLHQTSATIIQEQPHQFAASAQFSPLLEEQEDETQGTDAGTISIAKTIPLAEPTEKQPSTVPMMTLPIQFDEINLKQAQDTPDNILFSYQIGDLLEEEEVTSRTEVLGKAHDDVKTKLQDILQLLNQDIGLLVQDVEEIRGIFRHLKGQLPADVEASLLPAAFIEGHQFKVLQAK
ncbi:hypothetical protein C2845_PM14G10320 [Panicum miliaceum]|uniref:Uncharacterized protein n=1 Tax=Panicum miliaceum TaxID=4540 RepID=A0A3L6PS95_PANMI|nr:hypothetical protein C2845_PM14G10320 [Panicum miliaceum]